MLLPRTEVLSILVFTMAAKYVCIQMTPFIKVSIAICKQYPSRERKVYPYPNPIVNKVGQYYSYLYSCTVVSYDMFSSYREEQLLPITAKIN